MTVEDIIRGESKKVEFKETLPNRSENYARQRKLQIQFYIK